MVKTESKVVFLLAVFGAALIIVNCLWVAGNGAPIVLTSYEAHSANQLYANGSAFWGRVSFGIPGFVDTAWLSLFLISGVVGLLCGLFLLIHPERHGILSAVVIVCAIASIPIGGGFIIGAVLCVIGGLAGIEWPKPLQQTFAGGFLRILKLDSEFFRTASDEPKFLSQATWTLIVANVLSGFGYGIYNLTSVHMNQSANTVFNVLFLGQLSFDISVFAYPLIYIGIAVFKWLVLSFLVYLVGTKILGSRAGFDRIATVTALAYAPIALQVFLPVVFSNQLSSWGFGVFFFTNIWMILALLIGIRQALETQLGKTVGVMLVSGGMYWIIDYLTLVPLLEIPGIWFVIKPASFVLLLFSIGTLLAALTGVFSKRFKFD